MNTTSAPSKKAKTGSRPTAKEAQEEIDAQYREDLREWERERMIGVKTGLDATNNPDNW